MNREVYERVIASVLRAHPAATRADVAEMLKGCGASWSRTRRPRTR